MNANSYSETIGEFLESDDSRLVQMGKLISKGLNATNTENIDNFLRYIFEEYNLHNESENIKLGLAVIEEAGIEKEVLDFFSKTVNEFVIEGSRYKTPSSDYDVYYRESFFLILKHMGKKEKYSERIAEFLADFLQDHFEGEIRTGETDGIYEETLTLLGGICNDKIREKHKHVLISGAFRDTYNSPGYPESELNYTCIQILEEWDENQALIDTFLDYLYEAICDGQPCATNNELYNSILYGCQTSEEDLLENIPWEKAYLMLTRRSLGMPSNDLVHFVTQEECDEMYCFHDEDLDIIKDNYELRPEWTVSTLKACLRSEHKKFRDESSKALEELGISD